LIFLISAVATPLYHVRYVYTYASPFLCIAAAAIIGLWSRRRWLGVAAMAIMITAGTLGLHAFWTDERYASDDHRQAVADLAGSWQPGDAILVNAGWIYPVLDTYWPTDLQDAKDSLPPPISTVVRLTESKQLGEDTLLLSPTIVRSGSVDGDPNLGWENAQSDFYAVSQEDSLAALEDLRQKSERIWHYRLYDTVSDPQGAIRDWLQSNLTGGIAQPYPGRDFLQVQPFFNHSAPIGPRQSDGTSFGGRVSLIGHSAPDRATAGRQLHTRLFWQADPAATGPLDGLSVSLRLYTEEGRLLAQRDGTLDLGAYGQPMTLALPAATRPGNYTLEAIVYDAQTGAPLKPVERAHVVQGERWQLGMVEVKLLEQAPDLPAAIAQFDYLDLLSAEMDRNEASAGDELNLRMVWLPTPSAYVDTYRLRASLQNQQGEEIQSWIEPLGGSRYPSAMWPTGHPVDDPHRLPIDDTVAPGEYELFIQVERAADGLPIAARQGWWPIGKAFIPTGTIVVSEN
jgi:hypothetical protein